MKAAALLIPLIAALSQPLCAAELTDAQKAQIDQIATAALAKTQAPSASIAVITDGRISYLKAYGDAEISPHVAATPAVRYAIGSVSKQFTAAAVLMLAEDGKLSLDEPISRWYPHVTGADKITLRHLLSHTSGIADFWPQDYVMTPMTRDANPDKVIAEWGAKPLVFQPGERYEYSNTGFMIAGRIVEKVSGQSLEAFLRKRVWVPLGMTSVINYDAHGMTPPKDAIGYDRAALGPSRVALHEGSGWGLGAFQWAMTAEDLAKWDLSLIKRSLLKPASYDQLFTATKLSNGRSAGYSLGLQVRPQTIMGIPGSSGAIQTVRAPAQLSHSGEVSGFVSANTLFPDDKAAVIVLTNAESQSPAGALATALGRIVAPPIPTAPLPPPPVLMAPAPSPTVEALDVRVATLFTSLQAGKIDRSGMTQNLSDYFSPMVVKDFADSLGPLGAPKSLVGSGLTTRGGMNFRRYTVTYPGRTLSISLYAWPDGKFEQFLVGEG